MLDTLSGSTGTWLFGTTLVAFGLYDIYVSRDDEGFPVSNILILTAGSLLVHESRDGNDLVSAVGNVIKDTISVSQKQKQKEQQHTEQSMELRHLQ
jgi:hypothetical protein